MQCGTAKAFYKGNIKQHFAKFVIRKEKNKCKTTLKIGLASLLKADKIRLFESFYATL